MLGGERGASVGVAVSFPCAFSRNGKVGIRGHFFWNWGNIWNSQNRMNWVSEVAELWLWRDDSVYGDGTLGGELLHFEKAVWIFVQYELECLLE